MTSKNNHRFPMHKPSNIHLAWFMHGFSHLKEYILLVKTLAWFMHGKIMEAKPIAGFMHSKSGKNVFFWKKVCSGSK